MADDPDIAAGRKITAGTAPPPAAPATDPDIVAGRQIVNPASSGPVDYYANTPFGSQSVSSGTPGPVGASTGGFIRDDMLPGPGTQVVISLAGDPDQKRRIAAAQLFPDLKPLEAQSRMFYGPNGRLAAVGNDGQAFYVDPLSNDRTVLGVPVPANPLSYVGSGAGPAIAPAAATATSALAAPASIVAAPLAGAAGGAAGDILRQTLAAKFDPGSPKYDPKATLSAGGTGAVIGATSAVGNVLADSGTPAISGVPASGPPGGSGPSAAPPVPPRTILSGLPQGAPPPGPNLPPSGAAVVPSAVGAASRNPAITADIPTSSAAAEAIAKPYYKMAETSGAGSTSQGTDAVIGLAEDKLPTGLVGQARGGAVQDFVNWVQQFKGKPLNYDDLSNIDKELGQRISDDYKFPSGLSPQGKDLFDIQTAIRQRLLNPQPEDLAGDASGFAAKKAGDKAWTQARKMEDVENMWAKANDTMNPDTSFANQVRNYKYSAKSRGWSDDEMAALDAAAKGGTGSIMHVLGSRMLEHTLTAAGTTVGGFVGSAVPVVGPIIGATLGAGTSAVASHAFGSLMRNRATAATGSGVQNALLQLGRSTPPSILTPP